jgi:hypothetical protein
VKPRSILFFALLVVTSRADIAIVPENWEFAAGKVAFEQAGARAVLRILPDAGTVILKAPDFADGTIEFDYQPVNPRFANIYFRWQSAAENECFYFRTARAGDPLAGDAVQYAPHLGGINLWDLLGHFQTNASFRKDGWNRVKLVFSGSQFRAYVNSPDRPTLAVGRMEGNVVSGRIAFEGEALIANLVVRPGEVDGLMPGADVDPTDVDPRYLRQWQVGQPSVIPPGIDFAYDSLPKPDAKWSALAAERRGLVNLTRLFGKGEGRRLVWVKTKLHSAAAQTRKLSLGFSDEVWVLVNGKLLYTDKNWYFHPIRKDPEGRCSIENTTFNLPLNAGDNELLIGIANDFYGWGLVARLDSLSGLTPQGP